MLPILALGCWAGLGVLAEAAHDNGTLTLRGTTPFLRKMLDTVGLSHFIALEERSSGHAA